MPRLTFFARKKFLLFLLFYVSVFFGYYFLSCSVFSRSGMPFFTLQLQKNHLKTFFHKYVDKGQKSQCKNDKHIYQGSTGVNFINVKGTNFSYAISFFYVHVTRKKLPKRRSCKKRARVTLMKLTTGGPHFMRSFYLQFCINAIEKWPFFWNISSNLW